MLCELVSRRGNETAAMNQEVPRLNFTCPSQDWSSPGSLRQAAVS